MLTRFKILNAICIIIICCILSGAFYFQFYLKENPCPLCLLQRCSMFGVLTGLTFNIFFGFKPSHFAIIIISALTGLIFATRQVLLHICPKPGEPLGYGSPIFGMYLYSWSVIIFLCCIFGAALFLLFISKIKTSDSKIFKIEKIAIAFTITLLLLNIVATFFECRIGPCCENGPCL